MAAAVSLESIPIVDNHCHAGALEHEGRAALAGIRQELEGYARGFVEARVPARVWREYLQAGRSGDHARLDEIDRNHHVRDLMERSLQMQATSGVARGLQVGCVELYGEWENRERLEEATADGRRIGAAALYERVLDLLNSPFVLTDSPWLERSVWSERRFKWIVRLDPLLYPFGPGNDITRGTDRANFYARFARSLKLILGDHGLDSPPPDFADYVAFADRAVESFLERRAVALKVVSAYVRPIEFRPVAEGEAKRVFGDLAQGKKEESRLFEDYLARRLLGWAADHGVPVQIHVGLGHSEPGMDLNGSNPLMLQSLLMDERYSNLPLVLLHGAYPYCSEAAALAWTYGNVYLDFSWMTHLHHHYLVNRLTEWLELLPAHKLLFGTDTALPEVHLGATRLGCRALEAALTRGVADNLWSPSQARWLGERVCYRNVCELYGLSI